MTAELRALPPSPRMRRLADRDLIACLGASVAQTLRIEAKREIRRSMRVGCSSSRIDAAIESGQPVSEPAMVRSHGRVRVGDGPATRRLTPLIAVEIEDLLDGMSANEALQHHYPPSVSALQFELMRQRGTSIEHRMLTRKKTRRKT